MSGAILAAVSVGSQDATVSPVVRTLVGGSLTASSTVTVKSDVRTQAIAIYRALQISGLVSIGSANVNATDSTDTRTAIVGTGSATSTGAGVAILAWHNFDGTRFLDENLADASVVQTTVSLGLAVGSADLHAIASATTKAEIEAGATAAAPNGTVELKALAGNYAESFYRRTTGALISAAPNSNPKATASGHTEANLLGHVRVFDGIISTTGAAVPGGARPGERHRDGGHQEHRRRTHHDRRLRIDG